MSYYFSDPTKKTFKAILFNEQIFHTGRGLFIHLEKYYKNTIKNTVENSRSKAEWTPENFAKATRGQKSHFKGIKFTYVDVDKKHREKIKELSKVGEGWWPNRSIKRVFGVDYEPTLPNFLLNYEGQGYYRRLGGGNRQSLEYRINNCDVVDFSSQGLKNAIEEFVRLTGFVPKVNFEFLARQAYYFLHRSMMSRDLLVPVPSDWSFYMIEGKKKRTFIKKQREELLNEDN